VYCITYLILNHIPLSTDVITGDNVVDRSVDLCKEAFQLITYDPMQGTHPALGVVDHVSTIPIYTHHHYDISQYSKYNSLSFHAICHLFLFISSTDLIPNS
jgi:glutamate formiminotransferase